MQHFQVVDSLPEGTLLDDFSFADGERVVVCARIRIYIKTLGENVFALDPFSFMTVEEVKQLIKDVEGSRPDQQRLMFARRELKDGRTLRDYNISDKAVVHLVVAGLGAD